MFGYTPKLYDAVAMVLLLILCLIGGAWARGRILLALNIGSIIFAVMTAIIMILIVLESLNRRVEVQTEWMQAFGKLDDEARAAVAYQFPTMRYRLKRGEVRQMFEDTNVTIDQFRLFLKSSNSKYISPERDWNSKDKPRWVWLEIRQWLEGNGYVVSDSAAGSHSWLWSDGSYQRLFAYWMAGRKLTVTEAEDTRVYAYEEKL